MWAKIFFPILLNSFCIGNGFLFTPKIEIYLNVMKNPNNANIQWEKENTNPGFTYTTNQYGNLLMCCI